MSTLFKKYLLLRLAALVSIAAMNVTTTHAEQISQPYINDGELVGSARMTYLFWDVYDISLYSKSGNWQADQTFALELQYLRDLDGEAIAERSIEEMEGQGLKDSEKIKQWLSQMKAIFPDVDDETTLVALKNEQGFTEFLRNGQLIGSIEDQDFTQRFFDIWLSANTSQPKLRKKLLGGQS